MDFARRHMLGLAGTAASLLAAPAVGRPGVLPRSPDLAGFGPQPGIVQLSRNENPYGPSPAARRAIAEVAARGCYYSNAAEGRLAAMIAEAEGLAPDQVMIGAGSTEVLNCATSALGREGAIVAAELTFDPPLRYAERRGATIVRVPLRPDMQIDLEAMLEAARAPGVRAVHLVNPNNPTGLLLPGPEVRSFAGRLPKGVTLLLDEAYFDLADDPAANTLADRVRAGDDLIVVRTFSKLHGLAGLRVGYALARPEVIAALRGWSMGNGGNAAGLAAAIASYRDTSFQALSRARIAEARAILSGAATRSGARPLASAANFVFINVPDANRLQQALEARGFLIRPAYGRWTRWSRVSCGRLEEVRRLAAVLPSVLAA
ncbi:pyridoxal phosphate-dependent aminotransferase [Thermaurantiacus sp.]